MKPPTYIAIPLCEIALFHSVDLEEIGGAAAGEGRSGDDGDEIAGLHHLCSPQPRGGSIHHLLRRMDAWHGDGRHAPIEGAAAQNSRFGREGVDRNARPEFRYQPSTRARL